MWPKLIIRERLAVYRVLFGDFGAIKFESISHKLKAQGVFSQSARTEQEFQTKLEAEAFDLCIVNLHHIAHKPLEWLGKIRGYSRNTDVRILVVTNKLQRINVENVISAGADDIIAEPMLVDPTINRILYHLSPKTVVDLTLPTEFALNAQTTPFIELIIEASKDLSRATNEKQRQALFRGCQIIADRIQGNRVSMVAIDLGPQSQLSNNLVAKVMVSSDDIDFTGFPLDLRKYPEILHVLHTGLFVLVDDVSADERTKNISENVKQITIGSLLVFPLFFHGTISGVLSIRRPSTKDLPAAEVVLLLQTLANLMGVYTSTWLALEKIYGGLRNPKGKIQKAV